MTNAPDNLDCIIDELSRAPALIAAGRKYGIVVAATERGREALLERGDPRARLLAGQLCPVEDDPWSAFNTGARNLRDARGALAFWVSAILVVVFLLSLLIGLPGLIPDTSPDYWGTGLLLATFACIAWCTWPAFRSAFSGFRKNRNATV